VALILVLRVHLVFRRTGGPSHFRHIRQGPNHLQTLHAVCPEAQVSKALLTDHIDILQVLQVVVSFGDGIKDSLERLTSS
jgi:hypothetical protein